MNYLDELKSIPRLAHATADTVPAPTLRGESPVGNAIVGTLRRRQCLDLGAAYGVKLDENAPVAALRRRLDHLADEGTFTRPPKDRYLFMRAKYTADEVTDAKMNNGSFRRKLPGQGLVLIPCEALMPWRGGDGPRVQPGDAPSGAKAVVVAKPARKANPDSPTKLVHAEAARLGVKLRVGMTLAAKIAAVEAAKVTRLQPEPPPEAA